MVKLVIPTRNRPTSLSGVLEFLSRYYPNTDVLIADGSEPGYDAQYKSVVEKSRDRLRIEYRRYPVEMGYIERLLAVLESLDDEHIAIGADDDYPMMDTFNAGEEFLIQNPDYVTVVPTRVVFIVRRNGKLKARLKMSESVDSDDVKERVLHYSNSRFATTYATTKRRHLIERYRRFQDLFLVGFFDYQLGLHDCTMGKLHAIDDVGIITTRNFNHSYIRRDRSIWLGEIMPQVSTLRDILVRDLVEQNMQSNDAEELATKAYSIQIAHHLAPHVDNRIANDVERLELTGLQAEIYENYRAMFTAGTDMHERYFERMRMIVDQLVATTHSDDNADEPEKYATAQMDD